MLTISFLQKSKKNQNPKSKVKSRDFNYTFPLPSSPRAVSGGVYLRCGRKHTSEDSWVEDHWSFQVVLWKEKLPSANFDRWQVHTRHGLWNSITVLMKKWEDKKGNSCVRLHWTNQLKRGSWNVQKQCVNFNTRTRKLIDVPVIILF